MQTIVLTCLFGVVFAMVMWVVLSAAATRDRMMRRGERQLPPDEY